MAGRRGPALILTYHRVSAARDPLSQCVRPDRFESHLARLARLADVVPLVALDDPAPGRRIAITFDDGYADNAATAAPLLQSAGLPATFFVTGRVVDDPR
jgi:peptidoglycan/xylan/chitin deacetylase (PgdA/CDA1 family)